MSDERITNLEIKLSFTEDLIEKLNETMKSPRTIR